MRKNNTDVYMTNLLSTLNVSNMTRVNTCLFASPSVEDELDKLGDALVNDEELYIDSEGVIHTRQDVDNLNTLDMSNMTKVNADPFAGTGCTGILIDPEFPEDEDGCVELELDDEGFVHENDEQTIPQDSETEVTDFPTERQGNMQRVDNKPFAAGPAKPSNPDQWYNKNPTLFRAEIAGMRKRFPDAKLGFIKNTGNMYWIVTTKVAEGVKPWTFLLEYEKDHPNNHGYGGSVHVQLLKSPSHKDLEQKAAKHGRPGIPHRVSGVRANGENYVFLCTRRPEDVCDGSEKITTAAQVTGWAADWALHFETGMVNKKVWNKWCDDPHFRHLMIP